MSLAGGIELDDLWSPFHPSYSMIIWFYESLKSSGQYKWKTKKRGVGAALCPFPMWRSLGGLVAVTTLSHSAAHHAVHPVRMLISQSAASPLKGYAFLMWIWKEGIVIWATETLVKTRSIVVGLLVKSVRFWWNIWLWTVQFALILNGKSHFSDPE